MLKKRLIRTILLAFMVLGLAACSSTSEEDAAAEAEAAAAEQRAAEEARAQAQAAERQAEIERQRRQQEEAQRQADAEALNTTTFYFGFDVAEFDSSDRETLAVHARNLASNPNRSVRLEGHADERGTREYNLALAERRANSIRDYLIVNGASRSQIEVVSYGEERPANPGQSDSAYAENRRVEIVPQ